MLKRSPGKQDTVPGMPHERQRIFGAGRALVGCSCIGWPPGTVRREGAEAGGVFMAFRDANDMAAALALAVVMDKERARVGWPAFPNNRGDRAEAR